MYSSVGLQNHPYLYSQYPIDFPSASSHAYSVSGMTPQFPTSDVYSPTALASHSHTHEMLQQSDATAQQSQSSPTVQLVNATRATERWDGKSLLLKFIEPLVDGIKTFVDPIANVFMDAMPATFRGLTSHVSTTKSNIQDVEELQPSESHLETVVKPKEILMPQPRNIAQRKSANVRKRDNRNKPKKYNEMKINLDKMKNSKDYNDYIKTKKYKYNYPRTHYYPRVKYFTNPNTFIPKPVPYLNRTSNFHNGPFVKYFANTSLLTSTKYENFTKVNNSSTNDWTPIVGQSELKKHTRTKRDLLSVKYNNDSNTHANSSVNQNQGRGFFDFLYKEDPINEIIDQANKYTKSFIKSNIKHQYKKQPPKYYLITYDMVMFSLQVLDDFVQMKSSMYRHLFGGKIKKIKPLKIKKKKKIHKKKGSHLYKNIYTNTTEETSKL